MDQPIATARSTTAADPVASGGDSTAPSSSLSKPRTRETAAQDDRETSNLQLRYKLAAVTFKTLSTIGSAPSRRDVLTKACSAIEFQTFPIKLSEKGFFREVNDHMPIPYAISDTVSRPWQKVFLLVQLDLTGQAWPNKIAASTRKELHSERGRIYIVLDRVLRCIVDILGERLDGRGVTVALDVLRSVKAGAWEGSRNELLQVDGIGPAKMAKLAQAGIKTIKQLRQMEFFHIERLLSRNPPFGHQILSAVADFPVLNLELDILGKHVPDDEPRPMWIARFRLGLENEAVPSWEKRTPWTTLVLEGDDGRLVWFWRGSAKKLVPGKQIVCGIRAAKEELLHVTFACEEIVGTLLRGTIKCDD